MAPFKSNDLAHQEPSGSVEIVLAATTELCAISKGNVMRQYSIAKHPFPFTDASQRLMNGGGQEEATSTSDTGCWSEKPL